MNMTPFVGVIYHIVMLLIEYGLFIAVLAHFRRFAHGAQTTCADIDGAHSAIDFEATVLHI